MIDWLIDQLGSFILVAESASQQEMAKVLQDLADMADKDLLDMENAEDLWELLRQDDLEAGEMGQTFNLSGGGDPNSSSLAQPVTPLAISFKEKIVTGYGPDIVSSSEEEEEETEEPADNAISETPPSSQPRTTEEEDDPFLLNQKESSSSPHTSQEPKNEYVMFFMSSVIGI